MILIQAIRNAMVNDLVVRNAADLAAVPAGKAGWPSRSLNLERALAVLDAAEGEHLWPYTAMSMCRHRLRPVTRTAAIALGPLFESRRTTDGGQT